MEKATFIYEPASDLYDSFEYIRDGNKYYCDKCTADAIKIENKILEIIDSLSIAQTLKKDLVDIIEDYGEAKMIEATQKCENDFAEREAGASL